MPSIMQWEVPPHTLLILLVLLVGVLLLIFMSLWPGILLVPAYTCMVMVTAEQAAVFTICIISLIYFRYRSADRESALDSLRAHHASVSRPMPQKDLTEAHAKKLDTSGAEVVQANSVHEAHVGNAPVGLSDRPALHPSRHHRSTSIAERAFTVREESHQNVPGASRSTTQHVLTFRPSRLAPVTLKENICSQAVFLHIYDVSQDSGIQHLNEVLASSILPMKFGGVFHAGVEVNGKEWSFGYCKEGSGVCFTEPRRHPVHHFRETVFLPRTQLSSKEIAGIIKCMAQDYPGR